MVLCCTDDVLQEIAGLLQLQGNQECDVAAFEV
jgi:hypothetical protein